MIMFLLFYLRSCAAAGFVIILAVAHENAFAAADQQQPVLLEHITTAGLVQQELLYKWVESNPWTDVHQKASDEGDADAMTSLGLRILQEQGKTSRVLMTPKKRVNLGLTTAFQLLQGAAGKENVIAMGLLGHCYLHGIGTPRDETSAVKWLEKASQFNIPEATHALATCYLLGIGVAQDEAKAAEHFKKAADMGNHDSMRDLGLLYERGQGVKQSYAKAAEHYFDAMERRSNDANIRVARLYWYGLGVERDVDRARRASRSPSGMKYDDAELFMVGSAGMLYTGLRYTFGKRVLQDHDVAMGKFVLSAGAGSGSTTFTLPASVLRAQVKDKDPVKLYSALADAGHVTAMAVLGRMHEFGDGANLDLAKAVSYYTQASALGSEEALESLGDMYVRGNGVQKSSEKALELFRKADQLRYKRALALADASAARAEAAAEDVTSQEESEPVSEDWSSTVALYQKYVDAGDIPAMLLLAELYRKGNGEIRNHTKVVALYEKAAEMGHVEALVELGEFYHETDKNNIDRSLTLYQRAADKGSSRALYLQALHFDSEQPDKALQLYKQAAERGSPAAALKVAECYKEGRGTEKNMGNAVVWLEKATEMGSSQAASDLAELYIRGDKIAEDPEKGAKLFEKAVDLAINDVDTYIIASVISRTYDTGWRSINQDYAKSAAVFQKIADRRDQWGYRSHLAGLGYVFTAELGRRYVLGKGVRQDYSKAFSLFKDSEPWSLNDLAFLYKHGLGVQKDLSRSAEIYRNRPSARTQLGFMYAQGQGVKQDYKEAAKLFQRGVLDDEAEAMLHLGALYTFGQGVSVADPDKAIELFSACAVTEVRGEAAQAGSNPGKKIRFDISTSTLEQMAGQTDLVRLYQVLADAGHGTAMATLGYMYQYGDGAPQDINKAVVLYQKAEKLGIADAAERLATMHATGTGVVEDQAKAVALFLRADKLRK